MLATDTKPSNALNVQMAATAITALIDQMVTKEHVSPADVLAALQQVAADEAMYQSEIAAIPA